MADNSRGYASCSLPDLRIPSPVPTSPASRRLARHLMNSPGPSPADIQNHLYHSFLEAKTADIALRVRGTWEAVYRLHRVVLIQSGFFRSLFTSSFSESRLGNRFTAPDEIDIFFDDQNITRAAFEICIARLYGGGPALHICPSLIPTPSQPLTPSFPSPMPSCETPPGHHPATPRFLLSLLATAVYLSIPSTASQALNSILSSVGPHTVVQYLNFALGSAIRSNNEDEPEAAVGLEDVAQHIKEDLTEVSLPKDSPSETTAALSQALEDMDIKKEDPSDSFSLCSSSEHQPEPSFHYGALSDKIGEAAACWLVRWGPDILTYENKSFHRRDYPTPSSPSTSPPASSRRRAQTIASTQDANMTHDAPSAQNIPVIWARGGVNAKWIHALVSSDALFVKDERERYEFARSVVELRREQGVDEVEEEEWTKMFAEGIYYSNMSLEEIMNISQDISPSTRRPFVPLSVLQSAHWSQSLLRHHITTKPPNSPSLNASSPPPPSREKELGLSVTTADILSVLSSANGPEHEREEDKGYYPVPTDASLRLGDNSGIETATTMDQLFDMSTHSTDSKPSAHVSASEANFFGLMANRRTASSCILTDPTGKSRWSSYPPFRFAVEFWDVDSLREKNRLHSHTVWYAGSLFNVYVQVVRKKGVQLGVYIHRQSSIDPIPPSSAPSPLVTRGESTSIGTSLSTKVSTNTHTHVRSPSTPSTLPPSASSQSVHYSPSIHPPSRTTTPVSTSPTGPQLASPTLSGSPNSIPATAPPVMPPQPYRDPRPSISAYFTISCASATGSSLTRFTSAPDVFSVSQSWGWKSSSLRTEEYLEVGTKEDVPVSTIPLAGREVSLRATVVLGVV